MAFLPTTLLDAGGSRTRSFTATEVFCWAFSLTRLSRFFEYRFSNLCDSRQLVSPVTIHCRELADTWAVASSLAGDFA